MGIQFRDVREKTRFTNPQIRFRRIRGRIVPIFNKKRIGQDLSSIGATAVKFGAAVAIASLVKRTRIFKSVSTIFSKFKVPKTKTINLSKIGTTKSFALKKVSLKSRVFKRSVSLAGKSIKFGLKHSGKLGVAAFGLGIATSLVGAELEAQSKFGKDISFTKRGR